MNKILSIENLEGWSWSGTVLFIIKELAYKYTFLRLFRNDNEDIKRIATLEKEFDVLLLQNVDAIRLVNNKKKGVCRMGGIRTFKGTATRFDDDMREVFAIIATNKELYDIAKRVNKNVYLIPNGLDLDKFKPIEKKNKTRKNFIVGFAGNVINQALANYKGFDLIQEAVKKLEGVELKTALYGDKQIPHNEMVEKFYHKIDCLILASINEGCSNVVMEALACGIPVILTKVGYHGEMLEDGKNCLFIKRDIKDITKKISLLRDDISLQKKLAKNGREFAEKYHDIKEIAKQYDEIFQQCIEYNKELEVIQDKEIEGLPEMVKVRALKPLYEKGLHSTGEEFYVSKKRIKALGDLVEVINNEEKEEIKEKAGIKI